MKDIFLKLYVVYFLLALRIKQGVSKHYIHHREVRTILSLPSLSDSKKTKSKETKSMPSLSIVMTPLEKDCCQLGKKEKVTSGNCDINALISNKMLTLKGIDYQYKLQRETDPVINPRDKVNKKILKSLRKCKTRGMIEIVKRCCLNPDLR